MKTTRMIPEAKKSRCRKTSFVDVLSTNIHNTPVNRRFSKDIKGHWYTLDKHFRFTMDNKMAMAGMVGGLVGGLVGAVAVTMATRGRLDTAILIILQKNENIANAPMPASIIHHWIWVLVLLKTKSLVYMKDMGWSNSLYYILRCLNEGHGMIPQFILHSLMPHNKKIYKFETRSKGKIFNYSRKE